MTDAYIETSNISKGIRGVSLRQIEVFHAVFMTRSISAASRHLSISQPVVSRTVKRLEDVLDVALFQRTASGLTPTMEAELIFKEVDIVMSRLNGLGSRIEGITSGRAVPFRLGATASVARGLVPRALQTFNQGAAKPDLFFDVLAVAQIAEYLLSGTGQCVMTLAPADHPMLNHEKLGEGELIAIVPVAHHLAQKDALSATDFDGVDIMTFQVDGPHQSAIRRFFNGADIEVRSRAVVRFADTAVALASEGMGIALVDSFTAMGPMGSDVVMRPLEDSPVFSLYLQWNPELPSSAHVHEFRAAALGALANKRTTQTMS